MSEHVEVNRTYWTGQAADYAAAGERNWALATPRWGCFGVPNDELPLLPPDLSGLRAIELGCGTAYGSAWMARRGASVVGVDVCPAQLETARRLEAQHQLGVQLLEASAETTGLHGQGFDFALSEYGAALWCEPHAWLAEAARLLRPGGRLALLSMHPLASTCSPMDGSLPITERLERPWFGPERYDWRDAVDDPGGIEFVPTPAGWFRHAAATGFRVIDYREVQAPAEGADRTQVTHSWARRWPAEQALWLERLAE